MMPQNVKNDPKKRTYHFSPSLMGELLDFTCRADPADEPLNAADAELVWSEPTYQVAAYHHEQLTFTAKDVKVGGQLFQVAAISSSAAIPQAIWARTGDGCISPSFISPKAPIYDEPVIVELVVVLVATGSSPAPNLDLDFAAPLAKHVRRSVKIIWTPHVGDE